MEDGSAVPMEAILIQSGALGFYQKRLFFCSCFLQALTVSALVYASHCRPDLTPTSSHTATNGVLAHRPKCGSKSKVGQELLSENRTSMLAVSIDTKQNGFNNGLAGVTLLPVVSNDRVSSGYENVARAEMEVSTGSIDRDNSPSSIATWDTSRKHHLSGQSDRKVREKTAVEVISPADIELSSFNSVSNARYVSWFGYYATSTGVPENQEYVKNGQTSWQDNFRNPTSGTIESMISTTRNGDSLLEQSTADKGSGLPSVLLSSNEIDNGRPLPLSTSVDDNNTEGVSDVTVPLAEDKDCDESSEEADPFYLTLTYLPAPEWLRDRNTEELAQFNTYCQAVGAMVGAALGAMGADQAGRRKPLYVYFPLMLIAHCMSGFAVSWTMLAVFRFFVGLFAGACAVVSVVFPLEFIGMEWRDACICSGIWVVGVVVISLELLITRHWRYLAFISGGVGVPLIGTYFIASESARWLLCHQKFPEAEATLKELISCNSSSVSDFLSLLDKSRACVVTNMHHKRYTFLDLFHSVDMTKWTIALVYTCLVGSSVYFCLLTKIRTMTGNVYLDNSLPFVIDLPLGWSAVVVNRCLGRRWCLFLYAVASGLALLSVLVLHMTGNLSHMPSMLTGMAVFGKIGVAASLGLVFVIAIEMYPTVVRCMGVAVGVIAVTGGSLLADTFVFLEAYHYTVPFVVFGAMMASVGFAGLLFPETLHRPLPNILPCRHRTIPLHEGVRLVTNPWDVL